VNFNRGSRSSSFVRWTTPFVPKVSPQPSRRSSSLRDVTPIHTPPSTPFVPPVPPKWNAISSRCHPWHRPPLPALAICVRTPALAICVRVVPEAERVGGQVCEPPFRPKGGQVCGACPGALPGWQSRSFIPMIAPIHTLRSSRFSKAEPVLGGYLFLIRFTVFEQSKYLTH